MKNYPTYVGNPHKPMIRIPSLNIHLFHGKYPRFFFFVADLSLALGETPWDASQVASEAREAREFDGRGVAIRRWIASEGPCWELTWVFPKNRGTPKWMVYNGKLMIWG